VWKRCLFVMFQGECIVLVLTPLPIVSPPRREKGFRPHRWNCPDSFLSVRGPTDPPLAPSLVCCLSRGTVHPLARQAQ